MTAFRRFTMAAAAAIFTLAAAALPAVAQDSSLDDILKRGKVLVGMDMSAPPFAYQDENQQPAGSEVEVAKLIAKDLGVAL